MTKEKFQQESKQITKQVSDYENRLTELNEQLKSSTVYEDEEKLVERLVGLTGIKELTRELVQEFISTINVYPPEHIEVVWKCGDFFEQMIGVFEN